MNDQNETNDVAPVWMTTQAPKTDTDPPPSGEKKTRKPRRTKAQMLADAEARPDAERTIVAPSLLTEMAAADHRDAVVRDVDRIVPRNEHAEYVTSRLAGIAIGTSLLALATAIVAICK